MVWFLITLLGIFYIRHIFLHIQAAIHISNQKDLAAFPVEFTLLDHLTAGAAYIRVFILYYHIKYHLLNMLKIKWDINIWKQLTSILSNLNNFHSLEVVDRVSETQLQVSENSDWIIWRLKR